MIIYNEIHDLKKSVKNRFYDNKKNENKIRIFGNGFVKNNKYNCKLIIDNKELELCEEINAKNKKEIKI